jgi:hypothetical protein
MTTQPVVIYHNTTTDATGRPVNYDGFIPGESTLEAVHLSSTELTEPTAIAEEMFYRFNVGEDEDAMEYRSKSLRSLSVGDVVVMRAPSGSIVALACDRVGWKEIEITNVVLATLEGGRHCLMV